MEQRILEFVGDLRRAEIRISPSEALDALVAAGEIGLGDRATFKAALGATLVKQARDRETFEDLFDRYFPDLAAVADRLGRALAPEDPTLQALINRLLAEAELPLDDMSELLLRGSGMELAAPSAGLERLLCFFRSGEFSLRMYGWIDWGAIERDLSRLEAVLEARGLEAAELARIRRYLADRLEAFRRMVRARVEEEVARRADGRQAVPGGVGLEEKPIVGLAAEDLARMTQEVQRLARRLKDALALRQRRSRRGRLDARRTLRRNLQYGGIPMEMVLRHRRRDRPKVVALCDVSDSVGLASRFLLQLLWSLQECFDRVRSYVFVSEIAEVTEAFRSRPVERAIQWALRDAPVDHHGLSDYGSALARFARAELTGVDSRTTVLILGDARGNYRDPQERALGDVRQRAKAIIWLNPQVRPQWGLADSMMPIYAPYCTVVRECRTLRQLGEAIDSLVNNGWHGR